MAELVVDSGGGDGGARAEIDTSAPFDSVKEAVTRFGGLGFWKPKSNSPALKPSHNSPVHLPSDDEDVDVAKVEEQAALLEKELVLKERETFDVLKELEATKMIIEELKSRLQKEESNSQLDANVDLAYGKSSLVKEEEEEKENNPNLSLQKLPESTDSVQPLTPGMILMELKQAKLNLTRTTGDIVEIRASVEAFNKKIERERIALDKTRERLRTNSSKISSLEEEINQTRLKLERGNVASDIDDLGDCRDIVADLQRLTAEAEQFKKMGVAAKSEVVRVMLDIEQTRAKLNTAEVRLVAARKMKEAARAAEAIALTEIKALEKSKNASEGLEENPELITLTLEEYSSLRCKAQNAEGSCNVKAFEAMLQVDEAKLSKEDIMKRVDEAMEEIKSSEFALEEALNRVEAANQAKLVVEEALRKWRSEHGERKRSSMQNSTKFKNPCPSQHKRDARVLDLNGISLVSDATTRVLKPTLSIGQILSKKLLIAEEYESGKVSVKRKVSLGQMIGKHNGDLSSGWKRDKGSAGAKKLPAKRKKFGFARFSVLLSKQQSKKKKSTPTTRLNFLSAGCKGEPQQVDQSTVVKSSRWKSKLAV